VAVWHGKYDAINGRVQQMLTPENEMRKQLAYQAKILDGVRKLLAVEKNAQILPTLKERLGA
jgi:hypothetical protein